MSTDPGQGAVVTPSARQNPPVLPSLTEIVEKVIKTGEAEVVTVRDVIDAVGDASFAPVLLLPALAVATPLSGIPLFSSLMGLMIVLISLQMLLRRDRLWLPKWILRRNVKGDVVSKAFAYLRPAAAWLDDRTDKRLRLFVRRPMIFVPQMVCAISGACMPLLEFIPFTSSIMGIGVALLALGMLARDGLALLLGMVPYSIIFYLIFTGIT
ncbi:exopolysaccharide biosynthesis protein [Roseobacter sp. CCS2]|uniref:exopolysaccharide biosynthesis protein n=1 Tax=Roseobacter sp. CCS2 TaxID=391593 RepID=UPI0000F3F131|nr:exopolysaccharide biosynthesis protein [Roseobacter sp. CCS2]EBA11154.1 Exopolysaccharide synthesis, ExoD [Roseobacter sp. CCS2]